jgi:hypothetical protein
MTEHALDHLNPKLHHLLELSDTDRIARIRSDCWLAYPRGTAALQRLADLVTYPKCSRMPSMLIWGESGMGKTMIAKTHLSNHPPIFDDTSGIRRTPVLSIEMPSTPDPKWLFTAILQALGAPLLTRDTRIDLAVLAPRTYDLMEQVGLRMLMIDELHNLLVGSNRIQRTMLNQIRQISNQLEISIVCLGTQEAREALMSDPQLVRRFDSFELKRWKRGEEFYALMNTMLFMLPLRKRSMLGSKSYDLILARTGAITSNIFRLLAGLAVEAIRSGREQITAADIQKSDLIPISLDAAA